MKQVEFRDEDVPSLGDQDTLIRIKASGICGTDLNSYRQGVPGGFGHEMSGVVEAAGKDSSVKVGSRVFVSNLMAQDIVAYGETLGQYLGAFVECVVVRNATINRDVYLLPDQMTFEEGAYVEPFCVSMSGVKKYNITEITHAAILGAGIIGLGCFEYLKSRGVKDVVVVDTNDVRLAKAQEMGAIPCNTKNNDLSKFLFDKFGGGSLCPWSSPQRRRLL